MNVIIRILRCSPNLESPFDHSRVYLLSVAEPGSWKTGGKKKKISTKVVVHTKMKTGIQGIFKAEILGKLHIACLLLEHGNALEELVFSCCNKVKYNEKSMKIMSEVSKFHKASPTVKLTALLKDEVLSDS
nr:hypothetical protein [Tanacetum cinerariifolium]